MPKSFKRTGQAEKSQKEEVSSKPAFQSRKTVADYVREKMNAKNRKSYYQRLIAVTQHKETHNTFINLIRSKFDEIIEKCNSNSSCERISGMYLYYKENSVFVVEGSEDVVGKFLVKLYKIESSLFEQLKILIFINNIGNTYFNSFVWRTYEPPSATEQLKDNVENAYEIAQNDMLAKVDRLFRAIGTELGRKTLIMDNETALSTSYVKIVPTINSIQFLLKAKHLFDLSEYAACFGILPPAVDYDSVVWPIPFDHTPLDVFKTGKYDVNLTFEGNA